jgi:hypothetical protein
VKISLKKALGIAVVLGWASTALTGEPESSGSASGSMTPIPGDNTQAAGQMYYDGPGGMEANGDECRDSGVIAGVEWHILRPVINDNIAFIRSSATGLVATNVQENFQYPFSSDPSIWLGYRTEGGLGFSVTWFHMDHSARDENTSLAATTGAPTNTVTIPFGPGGSIPVSSATLTPGTTANFVFKNDIKMDIWDLDVTQKAELGRIGVTAGAGIRCLHIAQDYSASAAGTVNVGFVAVVPTAANARETLSTSYNGGGPTLLLNGIRRFGDSGVALYCNTRGGVVFGPKRDNWFFRSNNGVIGFFTADQETSDNEATIGFAEIELGVQWGRTMGAVSPFVRIGFEGREYWGAGTALGIFNGTTNSGTVGAYGLALSAGVGY